MTLETLFAEICSIKKLLSYEWLQYLSSFPCYKITTTFYGIMPRSKPLNNHYHNWHVIHNGQIRGNVLTYQSAANHGGENS